LNVESVTDWELLDGAAGRELGEARLQLHWAAQIPAAVGNSWARPMDEYAHLSLDWDRLARAMTSKPAATSPGFRVALAGEDMSVRVEDEDGTLRAQRQLAGSTLSAALEWLSQVAAEIGGSAPDAPLKIPDHELPDHAVGRGAPFGADPGRLAQLARWFANADRLLRGLESKVNHAGALRLWPHHFDIAILIRLDRSETGADARTIGVGLSPGDDSYAEPYWYVTPWPPPPEKRALERLPPLEARGVWHTEGWTGAVLPSSALIDTRDTSEQAGQVLTFVQSAVNAGWALLRHEGP
jgi:hypothetical protein